MKVSRCDFLCGVCSNIPVCCIAFYKTDWDTMQDRTEYNEKFNIAEEKRGKLIQYIPCPDCLDKENFVEIADCMETCPFLNGYFCWEIRAA